MTNSAAEPGQSRPADPLGLSVADMRRLGHLVVDQVVDHWAALAGQPAISQAPAAELAALGGPVPAGPGDLSQAIGLLTGVALASMQHGGHPRYFARVPGPASFAAVLGEWLSTGYNAIASSWAGGSGPSTLELVVTGWLADLAGLPPGTEGVLVSGGSTGNVIALAAARQAGFGGPVYLSDQAHSSIARGLRAFGWPAGQIRVVPSGPDFRLPVPAVAEALRRDAAPGRDGPGAIVVATAGTTNTGAVDPLGPLAGVCQQAGAWLHVDGAYGAPAAFTEAGRAVLQGIEQADSLALDPHKWLFQPYDVGCVLVRRPGVLEACYTMNPEYLRDVQASVSGETDLRNRSLELSRRARAAKLWLTFHAYGRDGIVAAIEHGLSLAQAAQQLLAADPFWEVVTPAQLGVITFAGRGMTAGWHTHRARALTRDGYAAVSCTELAGRTVFRLCLINPLTTVDDVAGTLERLREPGR